MSTVDFLGETFTIADKVGIMPLMRFAVLAKDGVDADEAEGLVAMFTLLQSCLADEEWARFERHADKTRAGTDDLLAFVQQVIAVMGKRPTGRSTDSSDGPRIIEPRSTVDSSSQVSERVIQRFNEQGRPDLALLTRRRQESLSA